MPKVSVIVRKAYGAGLYAMSGPAFEPEATLALPTAKIAVMGPEAAVNAVFANKIAAIEDPDERAAFVAEQRRIYEEDVDLLRLASELVVDAVVELRRPAGRDRPPPRAGRGQGPRTSPTAATASRRSRRPHCDVADAVVRRLRAVLEPQLDAARRRVPDAAASSSPSPRSPTTTGGVQGPLALQAPGGHHRRLPRLAPPPALRRPAAARVHLPTGSSGRRTSVVSGPSEPTSGVHGTALEPTAVPGCGAVWLARLTGGQEVGGSNPLSPTTKPQVRAGPRGRLSVSGSEETNRRTRPHTLEEVRSIMARPCWCGAFDQQSCSSSTTTAPSTPIIHGTGGGSHVTTCDVTSPAAEMTCVLTLVVPSPRTT